MKVWGEVPKSWDNLIRKAMKIEGWDTISAYIRDLIREDLKRKGMLGVKSMIDADEDCEVLERVMTDA